MNTPESKDSLEDAGQIWGHFALQGNEKALSMLIASNTESIERRADKAFGVFRTEQGFLLNIFYVIKLKNKHLLS